MSDLEFPLRLVFNSDNNYSLDLASKEEALSWIEAERAAWQSMRPQNADQAGQIINNFLNRLGSINISVNDGMLSKQLTDLCTNYIPSTGNFGRYIARAAQSNPNSARLSLAMYLSPGSLGWMNSPEYAAAITHIEFYRIFGDPIEFRQKIVAACSRAEESSKDVEDIRKQEAEIMQRWTKQLADIETEWSDKITGYAAKMALGAPKEYWVKRAQVHSELAQNARKLWQCTLITCTIPVFTLGIISFLFPNLIFAFGENGDILARLAPFLERLFSFGTFAALILWWLRQKLLDMRSHEHLAEDAAERVTMVETFAAMTGAGLGDADFGPILSALYRTATAGLVPDNDSGPVLPLEILVKAMSAVGGGKSGT